MGDVIDFVPGPEKHEQDGQDTGDETDQDEVGSPSNATDLGNADLFADQWGGLVRFVPERGWMIYDHRRWAIDSQRQVMVLAMGVAKGIADPDWRAKSQARGKLNAMLKLAETLLPASMSDFDNDPWLFNCTNGTLDLRTGELQPHHPSHRLTRLAPVKYDPDASSAQWEQFVSEVMSEDQEVIDYLQRAVGYSLTGITNEQCLFFCLGRGRNGKSVFIEAVQAMMGEYGLNSTTKTVMKNSGAIPNNVARLAGARFVALNETGEGQQFDEPLIKDLTGGDTMTARYLFKEYFDFTPQCKLWIRGNHAPMIVGTDEGIWRRFRIIPFSVQIPDSQCDPALLDKLKANLPGILLWAVRGCLQWQASGLAAPQAVIDSVAQYRKESDPIGLFIEECCVLDPDAVVQATALYQAYRMWATQAGEVKLSQFKFGRSLSSRGFERRKVSTKVYVGLTLKAEGP